MAKLSKIEWDIIDARVKAKVAERRLRNASLGFLHLVLESYFPAKGGDFDDLVTDGANDRGIDAIEIIQRDHQAEVLLFQAKYRDGQGNTDKSINDAEVLRVLSFLRALFDKSDTVAGTGNVQLDEAVTHIWELHERGVICRYRIVFCSNDTGLSTSAKELVLAGLADLHNVTHEIFGPADLLTELGARDRHVETGFLQVVGKEAFERTDGDIRGVIASVDARSFIDMIRTEDGQSVKRHLFDDNLRVFLGKNGGYNPAIISTASSADSHLFWYLNNGITITCKDYSYNKSHVNPKIRLEGLQIVNGAQTSHSLLEAARLSPDTIENVVLTIRVYATGRTDIAERVAVATNSQARIQSRDLRANHPVLKKMEMAFSNCGYFFERKRNMHVGEDAKRRIDAFKLGQIIVSYYLREPERARTDSDAIFDEQFAAIFHEHLDIAELCRVFELYRYIEDLKERSAAKAGGDADGDAQARILIYGHWFVLYAARLLLSRNGKAAPEPDDIEPLVGEALDLVVRACSQSRSVSHYQLFRSPRTKDKILAEFGGAQMSLLDLLASLPD